MLAKPCLSSKEDELTVGGLSWLVRLKLQRCPHTCHMLVTGGGSLGVLGAVNSQRIGSLLSSTWASIAISKKKYSLLNLALPRPLTAPKVLINVYRGRNALEMYLVYVVEETMGSSVGRKLTFRSPPVGYK